MDIWQDLKVDTSYEICTTYPHRIRRRSDCKILSESISNTGYYCVTLKGKHYLKHRLIAIQFIPNDDPEHKTQVDHINRNRRDNHIENLRWISPSENNLNREWTKPDIRYVDELPELVIEVKHYGKHDDIPDLYYCDDIFYVRARNNKYRLANKHQDSHGKDFIEIVLPGLRLKLYYDKFKREYDLN